MINVKFMQQRVKLLGGEKATYFPRTRQVLIEYPIRNNGRGNVHHREGGEKEREKVESQAPRRNLI